MVGTIKVAHAITTATLITIIITIILIKKADTMEVVVVRGMPTETIKHFNY